MITYSKRDQSTWTRNNHFWSVQCILFFLQIRFLCEIVWVVKQHKTYWGWCFSQQKKQIILASDGASEWSVEKLLLTCLFLQERKIKQSPEQCNGREVTISSLWLDNILRDSKSATNTTGIRLYSEQVKCCGKNTSPPIYLKVGSVKSVAVQAFSKKVKQNHLFDKCHPVSGCANNPFTYFMLPQECHTASQFYEYINKSISGNCPNINLLWQQDPGEELEPQIIQSFRFNARSQKL